MSIHRVPRFLCTLVAENELLDASLLQGYAIAEYFGGSSESGMRIQFSKFSHNLVLFIGPYAINMGATPENACAYALGPAFILL